MVLAAGFGTRLRPLTDHVPKPLVPVGLETALGRWLRWFGAHGIHDVVVNLHHFGDRIRAELARAPVPGVHVTFSDEEELLGTGGGIRRALPHLRDADDGPFLVVNADVVAEPDLTALADAHRAHRAHATLLLLHDPRAAALGAVEVDAGERVRRLRDEPPPRASNPPLTPCVFTGISLVDPRIAPHLPERGCIIRTTHRALVDGAGVVAGVLHRGPWFDLGSPDDYLAANLAAAGDGVLAAPDARIDPGASVGPSVVLGAGAHVRAGAVVRRAVAWPGAVLTGVVEDAVVTPFTTLSPRASGRG